MVHLLEALTLFLFWRVGLSILGAVAVGGLVAFLFPGIGPAAVLLSLLAGVASGLLWQARAEHKGAPRPVPEPPISRLVSFLALSLVGAVWGGLAASSTAVGWVLLALAISPFVLGPLFGALLKRSFTFRQMLFAACALLVGLLVPLAIHTAAAREASNPSIERTASSGLRPLPAAAHVKR